jgi:hypothetical protein
VDRWGGLPYRLVTNSLGFKDQTIREISPTSNAHRVLLIGDSFTEGIGLEFKDTFAGMLYDAGGERQVDFLNAGVVSYSPTIYYAKIKHLIESGLQIDEVVVLPDLSDVQDEAIFYFCFDQIAEYRARCASPPREDVWFFRSIAGFWETHFALTDLLWMLAKQKTLRILGGQLEYPLTPNPRTGWIIPGYYVGRTYAPLGVSGGMERGLRHMEALAELLASRHIPLTVAVYPWPIMLQRDIRDSQYVRMWRDFCLNRGPLG